MSTGRVATIGSKKCLIVRLFQLSCIQLLGQCFIKSPVLQIHLVELKEHFALL